MAKRIKGKCRICGYPNTWLDSELRCSKCSRDIQRNNIILLILLGLWVFLMMKHC